jgi:hypothetical protein
MNTIPGGGVGVDGVTGVASTLACDEAIGVTEASDGVPLIPRKSTKPSTATTIKPAAAPP